MRMLKLFLLVTLFLNADFGSALKGQSKFLSPEEAFKVSAVKNGDMIETKIILGKKIHITDKSLKYRIIKPKNFELNVTRPKGHKINGDIIYKKLVAINIPISQISSKVKGNFTFEIELQGCSDNGICYNTIKKRYKFKTPEPSFFSKIMSLTDESNAGNLVDVLKSESSTFIILLFLILGLLLALTPCIFPMIPILSSIIVSQSGTREPSAMRGFFTSLVYVLSMAITYTAVGVISGLLGADIQSAMQNPWVLSIFGLLFFALAISLFGYYELQLPAKWQSKINSVSDNAQGKGGILGTAIMGFLSAFIIGPCVAPPLAGAVIFISQTGDALLGGVALFVMSLGMGLPLILVGIGAGKFMPRPGGWMTVVSQVFGVIMLALAIFMFGKVLSPSFTILLWSLLFIGTAIYMGVFNSSKDREGATKLFQLLAFVLLIYGTSLFIGMLSGSTSMLHPFEKFTEQKTIRVASGNQAVVEEKNSNSPTLGYSIDRLLKEVKESDKLVMVDFNKKSCPSCRELEEITFPDKKVKAEMKRFKFISIDITDNTDEDKALMKKYHLFGTPNIIFFDKNNSYLPKKSITGFVKPNDLVKTLKSIK